MMHVVERLAHESGFDAERFQGVSPDMRARMAADYRGANERFAQAVWSQPWDDVVATESDSRVNELAVCGIAPEVEEAIQNILKQAAAQFGVPLRHSLLNRPVNRLIEGVDATQRLLGYSRWRVL
jgi:hypothetical protein